MAKLRCNCLNICINTQGSDLKKLNGKSFLRTDSEDEFFKSQIYEVHLGVAGIQKEQEILMRERQIEDWTVYKCLGCNSEPYALHSIKREGRVLVSDNIKNDARQIAGLMKNENLSPAFKIILQPVNEEDDSSGNGFSSDTITSAGSRIQEQVKRFLKSEEDAMTERIRKYTEEQKRLYTAVQSRAYNDKRSFLSILRRAAETKVQESLSDAMADLLSEAPDERPLNPPDFVDSSGGTGIVKTLSISTSWSNREKSSDADHDNLDPLFHSANENFHDQAFDDSDEEESSDNSFNQTDMEYEKSSNRTRYSSSVPVNVPFMSRSRAVFRKKLPNDDEHEEMPSPDKIAESIQALARSVRDSRDIFGELPRPRKNTLPVTFN